MLIYDLKWENRNKNLNLVGGATRRTDYNTCGMFIMLGRL